jgi:hypothetical protein
MRWNQNNERRGVILLVVLSLLTLFAIVGISFVLYADAEAASARVARDAETQQHADVDPQQALAFFLSQFIYDVPDTTTGSGSALRGHSLARTKYGYNSTYNFSNNTNLNINPFNGVGRLHTDGNNWPFMNNLNPPVDDYQLVNYTWFQGDGFVRDPEWYTNGIQTSPGAARAAGKDFYVGCNAPYTYPDLNNFFLAAVRSDGTVLSPSYDRPWLFRTYQGKYYAFNDTTNPNWTNPQGKYLTLRPRPNEHPTFPFPDDPNGDVKNLVGWPGGNDSIWIDLGAPVMTAPDGTLYKMLFAPLIMDLDNRIHMGAAGNLVGNGNTPLSNQGWFPSEVNLSTLWSNSASPTEWLNLLLGTTVNGTSYIGKYGPDHGGEVPVPIPTAPLYPVGYAAHVYAQTDPDGRNELQGNVPTGRILLPGGDPTNAPATSCFPFFPQGYGSNSTPERIAGGQLIGSGPNINPITYRHPAAYSAYKPYLYTNTPYGSDYNPPLALSQLAPALGAIPAGVLPNSNNDLVFQASEMEALLRAMTTGQPVDAGSSALISNLLRLCPKTLGGTSLQPRNWITTISSDLARPALSPWIYNPSSPTSLFVVDPTKPALPPSSSNKSTFPTFNNLSQALPSGSDFTSDWRAASAALGRIDLNRPLPPYPHMGTSTIPAMTTTPNDRFDTNGNMRPQFLTATYARQQMALDIYKCLLAVTGVALPANPQTPTPAELAPRRWLAQLAVNIVDYIDADEISTPFNFYNPNVSPTGLPTAGGAPGNTEVTATGTGTIPNHPPAGGTGGNPDVPTYWVFGTELPRILINEVLGEYTLPTNNQNPPTAQSGTFNVNLWVELYNPMPASTTVQQAQTNNGSSLQQMDQLPVPLTMLGTNGGTTKLEQAYNVYQLVIASNNTAPNANGLWYDTSATPGLNNNVLGTAQYNYYVKSASSTTAFAGCNFGYSNGITGTPETTNPGYAGTVANPNPLTQKYPLFPNYPGGTNTPPWGLPGQSFMIVGPSATDVNNDITAVAGVPGTTPFVPSTNMQYQVTFTAPNQWTVTVPGNPAPIPITDNTTGVSVLLRRLANPHVQYNPFQLDGTLKDSTLPPNPYITVDYVSGIPLNGYGSNGTNPVSINTFNPVPTNNSPASPSSFGKLQPYAANLTLTAANQVDPASSQYVQQTTAAGAVNHHTFGSQNSSRANPYTWLVHLDRTVISPMELLHVSGFHPHELTQRFILGPNGGAGYPLVSQPYNYTAPSVTPANPAGYDPTKFSCFQHYVPWLDQTRRLYRFFEFLEAYNGASGVSSVNGRVPGKININTLWDQPSVNPQVIQAICDPPQAANADNANFTAPNVASLFQALLKYRTPNLGASPPTLSSTDVPFLGMAAGVNPGDTQYPVTQYSAGLGINNTLLSTAVAATQPTTQGQGPQFQLPNAAANNPQIAHPYLQNELLTKIYSRLTTRSNVFAVFLTVGFFQVVGAVQGSPNIPQLGPEIGRSEGRQVRHRMFAVVDRSQLTAFATTTSNVVPAPPVTPGQIPWPPNSQPITLTPTNQISQTYQTLTGAPWSISVGSQLVVEPGTDNEETVTVTSVSGGNGSPISITANFLLQHPNQLFEGNPNLPPYVVIQRGNPGPWTAYDPRKDPQVVPYFALID